MNHMGLKQEKTSLKQKNKITGLDWRCNQNSHYENCQEI